MPESTSRCAISASLSPPITSLASIVKMAYAPLIEATSEGTMDWGMPSDGGKTPYSTWYRITGDLATATLPPLVLLHGGPGCEYQVLTLCREREGVRRQTLIPSR